MNKIIKGDNQAMFRTGIAKVLASEREFQIAAECSDRARMMLAVNTHGPSIIVCASALIPNLGSFLHQVNTAGSRAIVIAEHGESQSNLARKGVHAILYRTITGAALVDCIYRVIQGTPPTHHSPCVAKPEEEDLLGARVRDRLTRKEMKILALVMEGRKNRDIAQRLLTTEQMIKNHLRSVYKKAGVSNRLRLALFIVHHRNLKEATKEAAREFQACADTHTASAALEI